MASSCSRGDSGSGGESSESESKGKISEYEKQRLSRIAENKARLEALGISTAAKALICEEDDDYRPSDGDEDDDKEEEEEDDDDFSGHSTCKTKASKRKVYIFNTSDPIGDDDDLDKAIALSLQDSIAPTTPTKNTRYDDQSPTLNKNKPEFMSKMQMTDDELVIYFYQFDEAGKGFITLRDVVNMATVHDFTWTQEDMIRCFDMDKDGKLSLAEFRKIVTRCRMLKES